MGQLLGLGDFALLNVIVVLHHLGERQNFLANLYRLFLVLLFLAFEMLSVSLLILCNMFREQDFFVLIKNV